MSGTETAKLFRHGGSQAVRLPKSFRLPGTEVRVRRLGRSVLLEPMERSIEDIDAIFAEIDRLGKIGYPHLTVRAETLRGEEYRELFRGAVCLQPYDPADFADRVSGVTLDALSQGCPVVTRKGTWMGRVVERFEAGRAVEAVEPHRLLSAAEEIVREYGRYRKNALQAGGELQREFRSSRLFEIVAA